VVSVGSDLIATSRPRAPDPRSRAGATSSDIASAAAGRRACGRAGSLRGSGSAGGKQHRTQDGRRTYRGSYHRFTCKAPPPVLSIGKGDCSLIAVVCEHGSGHAGLSFTSRGHGCGRAGSAGGALSIEKRLKNS
jgi:hypothetical protein